MSADEAEPEEAGEPGGMSERTAKILLSGVGLLAMWGLVAAFPWIAYVVVGVGLTIGWQRVRGWTKARQARSEEQLHVVQPDVAAALRRLVGDDKGVLLTRLRDDLKLPDTKAVKALLDEAGIPWKASRTREGNGPAVRKEAIPPAPSPVADRSHGEGCCCRSGDNSNSNNAGEEEPREGLRVERIGTDGYIIRDPADTVRHHKVRRSEWGHSGNNGLRAGRKDGAS